MTIAHISKITENHPSGCTSPYHAITDDGSHVILKTLNNCEGNRVLFNEWVSFCLAKQLRLPIPDAFWGIIDTSTDIETTFNTNNYGLCFCSSRVLKAAPLLPNIMKLIKNFDDIVPVILFDHWIYNADRNPGNILVDFQKMEFFIIDHSHVFADQPDWSRYDLREISMMKISTDYSILKANAESYNKFFELRAKKDLPFASIAESLFSVFNPTLIHDIIYSTPEILLPPQEDRDELEEYLNKRLDFREISQAIMSFQQR